MSATGTAREESQSMEFSVTKSALLNELTTTQGVVERKTTIPILSNLSGEILLKREDRKSQGMHGVPFSREFSEIHTFRCTVHQHRKKLRLLRLLSFPQIHSSHHHNKG